MEKLDQGQCEGFCTMCSIQECHFQGVVTEYDENRLDIATDRLIERIIREEHGEDYGKTKTT